MNCLLFYCKLVCIFFVHFICLFDRPNMRYLLLFLWAIPCSLSSQTDRIDSLTIRLEEVNDTAKVNVLLALSTQHGYLDYQKASSYAKSAGELAQGISYPQGEILSLYRLGALAIRLEDKTSSLYYLDKGLALATRLDNKSLIASGLYHKSEYYEQVNEFEASLEGLNRSLALYEDLGNEKQIASCYYALGLIYHHLTNFEKSLDYYFKALNIRESLNDSRGVSNAFSAIGNVYLRTLRLDEAHEYFNKSFTIDQGNEDREGVMLDLLKLGVVHQKKGNYEKAISYYERALVEAREMKSKFDEAILLGNMGSTLREQNKYNESLGYLFDALAIKKDLGKRTSTAHTCNDISETYLAMNEPEKARIYALEAISFSEGVNLEQYSFGYGLLAESSRRLGDFSNAYDYLEKSHTMKDSIFNLSSQAKMDELQVNYETAKKEEEIKLLTEQKQAAEFRRNAYLILGLMVATLLFLLFNRQRLKADRNKRLLEKEQEVEKMKARFFANISHEFRTPLTLILGPIESLCAETDDPEKLYNFNVMKKNAETLLGLVNQLLDLSKLEAGKFKLEVSEEDIVPIIKGIGMAFHSRAELKKIDLQVNVERERFLCYFDREKLETILANLMSNAFKFTQEAGKISLSFKVDESQTESKTGVIEIGDTGRGIPENDMAHIFNRFYQAADVREAEYQGTGIGLALTKELVELHKGSIDAFSELGKGTAFTVRLPLDKEQFAEEEIMSISNKENGKSIEPVNAIPGIKVPEKVIAPLNKRPMLLLVEDNEDVMRYLTTIFQTDYQILKAPDGERGIQLAQESIPDVIVSDVMMPKKDGYEVCDTLKKDERTSHIPIILLTAKADSEDKIMGLQTQADDYVVKPFVPRELVLRVNNLISSRKKLREKYKKQLELLPSEMTVNSVDEVLLSKVMNKVEQNMGDEHFGVEQLSTAIGMSRSQLHRKLKALIDQSPTQFIRSFRLQRAHDLLKQNAATASEIAYKVGFGSPSYFTKCFHKQYGCTPSDLSKKNPETPSV